MIRRPADSGVHTVEGNVAGSRAATLARQREKEAAAFAAAAEASAISASQSQTRAFAHTAASTETTTVLRTAGLKTAAEFAKLQKQLANGEDEEQEKSELDAAVETEKERSAREKAQRLERKRKKQAKRKLAATLSFAVEVEEEEDDTKTGAPLVVSKKDPTIDTSFLPDKQREQERLLERKRLEHEWKIQQATLRQEPITITYSYWDGSGHRRSATLVQGDTIGTFLETIRKELCVEFRELAHLAADALLYIKEDLIVPHDLTFYDLVVSKARGKSGPLFEHSVVEDVRFGPTDVRIETTESHPGKVVQRHWYERNKHIFPACRWEVFDPTKDYGKYRIGDRKKSK